MKWVGAFFGSFVAGGALAVLCLYFNPLSDQRSADVESTTLLGYEFGPETLSFTHGDQLGFDLQPSGIQSLWESSIKRSMLGTFVLENQDGGAVGIASRALKLSSRSNPLIRGIVAADHWLVTIPGAGSYFIESNENVWPVIRDTVIEVGLLGRGWDETRRYELSIGPNRNGSARVTGVSGQFSGLDGAAAHSLEFSEYEHVSQLQFPANGQLRLDWLSPAAQVATTP